MNSHPVAIPDTLPADDKPVATITTYKGFDKDLRCRDFQYEIGQTYETDRAVACETGFHACEYPLDVFGYYAPATSRFAVVEQSGDMARHDDDSKVASTRIAISAEIDIAGLVKAAVSYTVSRCSAPDPESPATSSGDHSASQASGNWSASQASGNWSASQASGNWSASQASGDRSASQASGNWSASQASGNQSASQASGNQSASQASGNQSASQVTGYRSCTSVSGRGSVASALGGRCAAKAGDGGAVVCVFRDDYGKLLHIRASKVGENGIKADAWYSLNENGEFVEVSP